VQDHQFLKTLPSITNKNERLLGLWFFHISSPIRPITKQELRFAKELSPRRNKEYSQARGYTRYALSDLFGVDPLAIPLNALPGKPPELADGWGHVSISHCADAFIIGWSSKAIGVDIERSDRTININYLGKRLLEREGNRSSMNLNETEIKAKILDDWVIKEAAIKLQKGNLFNDLSQWKLYKESQTAFHQKKAFKINFHLIKYNSWSIGIAINESICLSQPILCIY
tara:strand:- start:1708 stop:2391 length:684 start_codon:yes stop_codon:yes gene_type:complete